MTLLFSAAAHAQLPTVAIATDQSSLGVSSQYGVPSRSVADAVGDYAFVGSGNTALFYRPDGASTVRLLEAGDAVPGFTGSQITSFGPTPVMSPKGELLFAVNFSLADGLRHAALLGYDGANYTKIAFSDDAAPGSGGSIYGGLAPFAATDTGYVAFTASLVPLGPQSQPDFTTIYIFSIDVGGAPVRIAGVADSPVQAGGTIATISGISLNGAGQVLFSANVVTSGSSQFGLLIGSYSQGTSGIQKVILSGDPAPTGGTFSTAVFTGSLDGSGRVAFFGSTTLGQSGIWLWNGLLNSAPIVASGTSLLGGTLSNPTPMGFDATATDDLLLTSTIAGSATTTFAILRYAGGALETVAYGNEAAPGVSGKTFSSLVSPSIAYYDDTVSFRAILNNGENAIYTQTGAATPMLVALDGGTAPVSGGGTLNLATSAPRSLGQGLILFNAYVSGGTAYYGEFLGTSASVQPSEMSTADTLPVGARLTFPAFSAGTTSSDAFLAQRAGGKLSLFEVNPGSVPDTPTLLVTEGAADPGGNGPITFSYSLNADGAAIFSNSAGQVVVPASTPRGSAIYLATSGGLTKVAAVGDPSPVAGTTFTNLGLNMTGPSPVNSAGQVAFSAILSSGKSGIFLYGAGGIVKIAAAGDQVAVSGGSSGTINVVAAITGLLNPNLGLNSSGQVVFSASFSQGVTGYFIGSAALGSTLLKVAAGGDLVAEAGPLNGHTLNYLSGFNDQMQIVFQGTISGPHPLWGVFVAAPGGSLTTVALDTTTAPGTGGGTFNTSHFAPGTTDAYYSSSDASINNEGDVVFRSAITGGTTNSGYFRILSSGPLAGIVQPIVLQGQIAPGGAGTFGTITGAFLPGLTFALGNHGELAFAGTVVTSGGATLGGDFAVSSDGTISKILAAGDAVPGTGGGTLSLQGQSFSSVGDMFVFQAGASGGSANQAILATQAANTDPTTTTIASSRNPSAAGQSVTFTSTVGTSNGTPTGVVTFLDGKTSLGTGALNATGVAIFMTSILGVGPHSITAQYGGDTNYSSSTSNAIAQLVNAVSAVTTLLPATTTTGGPAFTLTVNGTNFLDGATVDFNGSPQTTTFVSATQLTALITAADIALPGWDQVTVSNPGGGVSNTVAFTVTAGNISPVMGAAQYFVPVTPCRIADTRTTPNGPFAGPAITGGASRNFTIPSGPCNIPTTAVAYSLNVAVIPSGPLGFLTLWAAGQTQPVAATVSSIDGRVRSNAAIVPAGTGGAISVFASNTTNLVLDINGYFTTDPTKLQFYPVTPCRLVDTRNASGPLGGPSITGNTSRTFPLPTGSCNLPATAQAYSLNLAVVPQGPLGYLTAWPTGQAQPATANVSSTTGTVTASAAIVPAGTSGSIDVYASNTTDLIIDVNGYFAPPGTGGLSLFTLPPCRVLDTRELSDTQTMQPFSGELDENIQASPCGVPVGAQAYVLNATVVPPAPLGYLTLWPQGTTQPLVATLSSLDQTVTSNLAIVPTTNGSISAYAANPTQLILDIFGYFAPVNPAQITSISVGPDQTLSYPSSLVNIPDEHTTFIPPGAVSGFAANEYLVFASSKTTGSTGGAVALQTSDLINFSYATGYGDSTEGNHVMWPVLAFTSCNPTYDSLYDENYSAPGSVLQDPTTGDFLMVYEAENHCPGDVNQFPFYASIGLAVSTDQGKTWPELVNGSYGPNRYAALQVPGPEPASEPTPRNYGDAIPSAYIDSANGTPYLYVAYTYTGTPNGPAADGLIRVARAQLGGTGALSFLKWYQGAFSQPGIGGADSGVLSPAGCAGRQAQPEISRNDTYGVYMMTFVCVISVGGVQTQGAWYYSTATNLALQNWTTPQLIANSQFPITDPCTGAGSNGAQFDGWYPSLVSPGSPSGHTTATGYVFFLNGCDGGNPRVFSSRTFTISGN
jgi:hypothetical protein